MRSDINILIEPMGKMLYLDYNIMQKEAVFLTTNFVFQYCFVSTPLSHFYSDCVWHMDEKVEVLTQLTLQ